MQSQQNFQCCYTLAESINVEIEHNPIFIYFSKVLKSSLLIQHDFYRMFKSYNSVLLDSHSFSKICIFIDALSLSIWSVPS